MEISQLIPIQGERKLFFERSRMFSVIVGFQDPIPESPGWDFTRGQAQLKRIEKPLRPAPRYAAAAVPRLSEIDWRSLRFVINDTPL